MSSRGRGRQAADPSRWSGDHKTYSAADPRKATPSPEEMAELIFDLRIQIEAFARAADPDSPDKSGPPAEEYLDKPWACVRCGWLLGLVDINTGLIRIRQKNGRLLQLTPGVGGCVQAQCVRCAYINEMTGEQD